MTARTVLEALASGTLDTKIVMWKPELPDCKIGKALFIGCNQPTGDGLWQAQNGFVTKGKDSEGVTNYGFLVHTKVSGSNAIAEEPASLDVDMYVQPEEGLFTSTQWEVSDNDIGTDSPNIQFLVCASDGTILSKPSRNGGALTPPYKFLDNLFDGWKIDVSTFYVTLTKGIFTIRVAHFSESVGFIEEALHECIRVTQMADPEAVYFELRYDMIGVAAEQLGYDMLCIEILK